MPGVHEPREHRRRRHGRVQDGPHQVWPASGHGLGTTPCFLVVNVKGQNSEGEQEVDLHDLFGTVWLFRGHKRYVRHDGGVTNTKHTGKLSRDRIEQDFYAWVENCGAGGVRMDRRRRIHIRWI